MRWLAVVLLLVGCRGVDIGPHWHFERMLVQPRGDAYRATTVFPDGRVMQPPPSHTLAHNETLPPSMFATSSDSAGTDGAIPVPLTLELLQLGRRRYDIVCAPCHGLLGDAVTPIAFRMTLRRPRSLHEAEIRAFTPGRLYQVIRAGYGFMPSYASMLTPEESWAVVAYVRALQLSHHASLDSLPPHIRAEAARQLGTTRPAVRP